VNLNPRRLLAAFIAACALAAIAPRPVAAAADTAVLRATLENGLRVAIVRDPLAPVVTEILNYGAGGQDTPAGFPGTAHAVEHMMFRGSSGLSTAQLANIESLLGGDSNADTQASITQYFFTVPAEYLDIALKIEATRMTGLLATQAEWALERGAIEQEVSQDESATFFRFYQAALKALFAGTPYAESPLGTHDRRRPAALPSNLVRSQQRDPGALRRSRSGEDARDGARDVRRDPQARDPRARGGEARPREGPDDLAR
jgi:zinc protease